MAKDRSCCPDERAQKESCIGMDAITGVQASLARKAQEVATHRFGDLWTLLCREEWICYALDHVLSNVGARTAGIDGVNRTKLKEAEARERLVREIQAELKSKTFKPNPVRRVYIPKANGKRRPLGIPTIKDRTVQMLLKMVLEPIWESDFLYCSNGFRIGRRTMDCIGSIYQLTNPRTKMYWAMEGDIRGCFDNIHHGKLMDLLERRMKDSRILKLIEQFLTAGVMEKQLFARTEAGTPQGGIISPLLANIYLHELDRYWWNQYGSLTPKQHWRRRESHQGNNHLIRYADDFLVLCNGSKAETDRLKGELGDFLRDELKLELSQEKTRITHINEGYTFLGFHIRRFTNPKGGTKPVVLIFPSTEGQSHFKSKVRDLTAMDRVANPLDALKAYNRLANGWAHYYRFVNAKDIFSELDHWAFLRLFHWFARYHQMGRRETWAHYVHQQSGRVAGTVRKNLAVKDDKGKLLYRFNMGDLEVRRYTWHKRGNPYLSGKEVTTVSQPEIATDTEAWTSGYSWDDAQWQAERLQKVEAVQYRCERCGAEDNLEIHHLKPAKGRDRTTLHHPLEWLEVLCQPCHLTTRPKQTE